MKLSFVQNADLDGAGRGGIAQKRFDSGAFGLDRHPVPGDGE
jgi:hypothetical protein